ncbi:23470_t:CDS:2, partial [Racocetra persica]
YSEKVKDMKEVMAQVKRKNEEITAGMDDKLDFFTGTCIAIDDYKDRLEKLEKMNKEANQLAADYKAVKLRGDEEEASRLLDETKDFFANISKNVFRNNTDFLNFKKEKVKDKEQGHFLGFVPSKYIGKLKWGADNTNFSYDLLLKFPFETDANITNGGISHLCCNNSLCYASSSKNCSSSEKGFLCLKINSTIYGLSYGGKCGGTIGNALIATNSTIGGRCITKNVSLSSIADYIATEPTNNFFGLDVGYAYYDCIGTASNVPCNPDFKYCN